MTRSRDAQRRRASAVDLTYRTLARGKDPTCQLSAGGLMMPVVEIHLIRMPEAEDDSLARRAAKACERGGEIDGTHTRDLLDRIAQNYVMYSGWFKQEAGEGGQAE